MDRPGQVMRTALGGGVVLVALGSVVGLSPWGVFAGVSIALVDLLLLAGFVGRLLGAGAPASGWTVALVGLVRLLGVAALLWLALSHLPAAAILLGLLAVPVSLAGRAAWELLAHRALAREGV